MSIPSLSSRKIGDIIDLLNTTQYLNEALHMAAGDGGLTSDATNALQALAGEISSRLAVIEDRMTELREALQ